MLSANRADNAVPAHLRVCVVTMHKIVMPVS